MTVFRGGLRGGLCAAICREDVGTEACGACWEVSDGVCNLTMVVTMDAGDWLCLSFSRTCVCILCSIHSIWPRARYVIKAVLFAMIKYCMGLLRVPASA